MSGFLDELARTLATPMPRSRAFRVLGAALVAAAVPGSRAFPADAATRQVPTCAGRCPGQKNCCIECPPIPSGGFPGLLLWCCRNDQECNYEAPSAQYRCGRMGCKSKGRECKGARNRVTSVKTPSGNDYGLSNSQLRPGQRIDASEAMGLTLGDGSILRLDKGTSLKIDKCPFDEPSVFELLDGSIWTNIKKAVGGQPFQVETPYGGGGVRGTTFRISYQPTRKRTTLQVFKGAVDFWARATPRRKLLVTTGQTAVQQGNGQPRITKR